MARAPLALARPQVPVGFLSWAHLEAAGARWPLHLPQPYSVLALISGDSGQALGTPSASTCRAAPAGSHPTVGAPGRPCGVLPLIPRLTRSSPGSPGRCGPSERPLQV